jgi:hypothetical protein
MIFCALTVQASALIFSQEKEGKYGFSYQSVEEAVKKIKLLLLDEEIRRARRRAPSIVVQEAYMETEILHRLEVSERGLARSEHPARDVS